MERIARKVLLIGWDAPDKGPETTDMDVLLAQEKLPNLARFLKTGVRGKLATPSPHIPPLLWTNLAAGKGPDAHGIYGFREPTPDGQTTRPTASTSRRCKALWNLLTQAGLDTNLVNWPATFPAETIKGAVISNLFVNLRERSSDGTPRIPQGCFSPERLAATLAPLRVFPDHLSKQDLLPFLPSLKTDAQVTDKHLQQIAIFLAQAASIQAAATWLMMNEPWDMTAVYFPTLRQLSAPLMPYTSPQSSDTPSEDVYAHYNRIVETSYGFHDLMLKSLLDYTDDETAVILVVLPGRSLPNLEGKGLPPGSPLKFGSTYNSHGIVCVKGPGIKKGGSFSSATLLGTTPTILTLLGLPVGLDMPAPAWMDIFEHPLKGRTLLSWEMKPGKDGRHPKEEKASAALAAAFKDLNQMGYIPPPSLETRQHAQQLLRSNQVSLIESLLNEPTTGSMKIRESATLLSKWIHQSSNINTKDGYLIKLVRCYLRLNEPEAAESALKELSKTARQNPRIQLLCAEIALRQQQAQKALSLLETLRKSQPKWLKVYLMLSQVYRRLERCEESEQMLLKAQALDESAAMPYYRLGQLYLIQDQPKRAADQATKALERRPYFPRAHFLHGNALAKLGQDTAAIGAFEACERMIRDWPQLYARLAYLYKKTGLDSAKAQSYAQKARALQQPFITS